MEALNGPPIEWSAASRAFGGETISGDRHLVKILPGRIVLGVVDGIGHGAEAAHAAEIAIAIAEGNAGEGPGRLLALCHERLRGTRGVVMSLAVVEAGARTMTWAGIGNVEALLVRKAPSGGPVLERLVPRPGVVGGRLPAPIESRVAIAPGDALVFVTDGVAAGFEAMLNRSEPPLKLANRILKHHGKTTDDATVLVARFRSLT